MNVCILLLQAIDDETPRLPRTEGQNAGERENDQIMPGPSSTSEGLNTDREGRNTGRVCVYHNSNIILQMTGVRDDHNLR